VILSFAVLLHLFMLLDIGKQTSIELQ